MESDTKWVGWGGIRERLKGPAVSSKAIRRLSMRPRCLRLFLEQEERALRGQAVGNLTPRRGVQLQGERGFRDF